MAQVLKENVRDNIIISARNVLLEKGYHDTSMRDIAKEAGVTVGNLYRYFDNKDLLLLYIIEKPLKEINDFIYKHTGISFKSREFNLNLSCEEILIIVDELANLLVEIHEKYPYELAILMMNSKVSEDMMTWFTLLVSHIIKTIHKEDLSDIEICALSKVYASSIFNGLKTLFKERFIDKASLIKVIDIYASMYKSLLKEVLR